MSTESRLYRFSKETLAYLKKFQLGTSRANTAKAVICAIDKKSLEIKQESDETVYTSLGDVADALPENSPRFVLLSLPVTLKSGRATTPYVMLYYMPVNANSELRMLYAGAKELMRSTAEAGKVIDVSDEEEVLRVKELLSEV